MGIHLPKPMHGWRAFAGEVGIIVLGVLIALAVGQVAEAWHWHEQRKFARKAMADELSRSVEQSAERLQIQDCLRDRITVLVTKLRATDSKWSGDPMPLHVLHDTSARAQLSSLQLVYRTPFRGWPQDAWDTAKATDTLNHMNPKEVGSYSAAYALIEAIRRMQEQEASLQSKLSFLSLDQDLDDRSRNDALATLSQLDWLNGGVVIFGRNLIDTAKPLDLPLNWAAIQDRVNSLIDEQRKLRGPCVKDVGFEASSSDSAGDKIR